MNNVNPLSPADVLETRKVNDDLLVTYINKLLKDRADVSGNFKIYTNAIHRSLGHNFTTPIIDDVMERFRIMGWKVIKNACVKVDRNEYDTVYDFAVK